MIRPILWLLADIVVGVVVAGAVSPWVIALVPPAWRGSAALGGVAIASVVAVTCVRRLVGIGRSERSR